MSVALSESEKQWLTHFERKLAATQGTGRFQTAFLDPRQLELAEAALGRQRHYSYTVFGGHAGAERNIVSVFPAQQQAALPSLEAVLISWSANVALTHRDLLGALMALGLSRDQVGDIIVSGEHEAAAIISASYAGYLCANLVQAANADLACRIIDLEELPLAAAEGKEVKGTVASLRVDAVLSLGFAVPRSRIVLMIKAGLVKVNFRPVSSAAYQLKEGDQISLRGRGRLLVASVEGKTRKGRTSLKLIKYS